MTLQVFVISVVLTDEAYKAMVLDLDCQLGVETLVQDFLGPLQTRPILLEELVHHVVYVGESFPKPVFDVVGLECLLLTLTLSHLRNQLLALLDLGALLTV